MALDLWHRKKGTVAAHWEANALKRFNPYDNFVDKDGAGDALDALPRIEA